MKTVSELAKELNVSVQTVYRMLNKVKQDGVDGLTEIKNSITYITSNGEYGNIARRESGEPFHTQKCG